MAYPTLKIAGRSLSVIAVLDYDEQASPIGGSSMRRMAGGNAVKLTHWKKWRLTISGGGWVPAPLLAIDYDQPFEVELAYPVGLMAGDVLPAGWTSRAAPWDEKTIIDQAGNSVRLVWPKLTVIGDPPTLTSSRSASQSWDLTLEQV